MSTKRAFFHVFLSISILFLSGIAFTQPMLPESEPQTDPFEGTIGVTAGFGQIAEDFYLRTALTSHLQFTNLTLSRNEKLYGNEQSYPLCFMLHAPGNLLLRDSTPEGATTFRKEDWDELGEQFRILRTIEYGTPYGGIYWRGGELTNVRIGHRSIVDNYLNNPNIDHFQWGIHTTYNTIYGGGEALVDSVTDPELVGGRVYLRPWQWFDPDLIWQRGTIGISAFSDLAAPTELAIEQDGRYIVQNGRLESINTDPTTIIGLDIEAQIVQNQQIAFTPYTDFNIHLGQGFGIHNGVFLAVRLQEDLLMDSRFEHRYRGQDYIPNYFGTLYGIERFAYLPAHESGQQLPKLQWLQNVKNSAMHGGVMEIGFSLADQLHIAFAWEDYEGPENSSIWMRLDIPATETVELALFYTRTNFDGFAGLLDFKDAFMIAESRIEISPWFSLIAQASRRWHLNADGQYLAVDDNAFSLGGSIAF